MSGGGLEIREAPGGFTLATGTGAVQVDSVRAALRDLATMAEGRRTWAVLGEIRGLGTDSMAEHDAIGRLAVRLNVSRLICVGEGARVMHLGASTEGSWQDESVHVTDVVAALALLRADLRAGDLVLVMSTPGDDLDSLAGALLADPTITGGDRP